MKKNTMGSFAMLTLAGAYMLSSTLGVVSAATPTTTKKKVTPTTKQAMTNSNLAGLSKADTKEYTMYYPKGYIKDKSDYYQTYYRNTEENAYGNYNSIGMRSSKLSKALGIPTTQDCKAIEAQIQKDFKASIQDVTEVDVKITPVSVRTFNRVPSSKEKNKVQQYGCNIEYYITIGNIGVVSLTRISVKKGGKVMYALSTMYPGDGDLEETQNLTKALNAFEIK